MPEVVTANRLTDGIVVYLDRDGGWTEKLGQARVADTEDETKALEAEAAKAVAARIVVAVYPDGGRDRGRRRPCSFRARAHPRRPPHHAHQGLVRCTAMTSSILPSCASAWGSSASRSSGAYPVR